MLGNIFWYVVARIAGIDRFKAFILRSGRWLTLDWTDIETARKTFGRFGNIIVLVGRMVPSIRSVVSIPAGLLKMKFSTFLVWSTVGTLIWTAGLGGAGWAAGRHIDRIEDVMGPISLGIVVLIFCMYVWRQINWSKRARRTTTSLTDGKA